MSHTTRKTELMDRIRREAPRYEQAIRDEDMQDLLLVRHELAARVREVDMLLADTIVDHVQRRIDG